MTSDYNIYYYHSIKILCLCTYSCKKILLSNMVLSFAPGAVHFYPSVCAADVDEEEAAVSHQRCHLWERWQVLVQNLEKWVMAGSSPRRSALGQWEGTWWDTTKGPSNHLDWLWPHRGSHRKVDIGRDKRLWQISELQCALAGGHDVKELQQLMTIWPSFPRPWTLN